MMLQQLAAWRAGLSLSKMCRSGRASLDRTAEGGCPHMSIAIPPCIAIPAVSIERSLGLPGGFAFQGSLQGVVQGCLCRFVFLLGDLSLLAVHFQLEQLFFQALEQHG